MSKPSGYKKRLAEISELKAMCSGLISQLHHAGQVPYFIVSDAEHRDRDPLYKWAESIFSGLKYEGWQPQVSFNFLSGQGEKEDNNTE